MGLKRLISRLDSGQSFGNDYPNTNTPSNVGGFNYGESISIFDGKIQNNSGGNLNDFFPFKQRSLGYGPQGAKDTTSAFGRLYGPAPYQKQRLPDLEPNKLGPGDSGPLLGDALGVIDSITDVGVRGGLITAGKRSAIDAARIGEYLLSAKGLGFITKNVGLQATNPILQEGAGKIGRNRVYNLGVNTLAQTLVNFSGLHITRQGLLPVGRANYRVEQGYRIDSNNDTKYEFNVRGVPEGQSGGTGNITNLTNVYKGNRLASLYNKLISFGMSAFSPTTDQSSDPTLYEFRGGPHSVYGIGKTRLKRYVFTTRDVIKAQETIIDQADGYKISRATGNKIGPKQASSVDYVIDFRKFRGLPYTDYKQKFEDGGGLEKKFGYPRLVPRVGAGYGSIPTNDDGTINVRARHPFRDRINSTDIWVHEGPWDKTTLGSQARDYIKFRIEAVNTDNPKESSTMVFRALLDSMDDNYSSKWNEYNYNGRAEPFYTFGSFNRAISFSFKVAAFTRDDMKPMYRKLNYLVSQTAGEYNQTRLRGNFCRLTIGDYHSRLPGFFTSINLKWNKEYPWEIAMYQNGIGSKANIPSGDYNEQASYTDIYTDALAKQARSRAALKKEGALDNNGMIYPDGPSIAEDEIIQATSNNGGVKVDMDDDMLELPHVLDVSCNFQPVHDFIPQKSINDSPFILPTKFSKPDLTDRQNWISDKPISDDEIKEQERLAEQEEQDLIEDQKRIDAEEERLAEEERKAEERRREEEFRRIEEELSSLDEEEEEADDFPPL